MKSKHGIAAALLVTGLSLGLVGCAAEGSDNAVAQGGTFEFFAPGGQTFIEYAPEERAALKPLSGPSLRDQSQTISLDDYAGKIVVLNSWGQWCAPCRSESDDLQRIHEEMVARGAGTVLGINVRDYNPQVSLDFVKDNGLEYPSIYDPPFKSAAALGGIPTSVVPTTIVLDKQHRPAAVFLKEVTDKDVLAVVDKLEKE